MPRKVEVDVLVDGTPEEVSEKLKENTRFSPVPYRGGPLTFGKKPMKGRVGQDRATVGLNRRDWWSMLQPTAEVTLEPAPTGTRVKGAVGMPDWMTWLLRAVVVLGIPGATGFASFQLLRDGGALGPYIAMAFTLFAIGVAIFGVGAHVHHANEQVDTLKERLVEAAGGPKLLASDPVGASSELAAAEAELERAKESLAAAELARARAKQ